MSSLTHLDQMFALLFFLHHWRKTINIPNEWCRILDPKWFIWTKRSKLRSRIECRYTLGLVHTSWNSFNKWTKISSLDIIIFELKNDGKKWSRIYFEIHRAPSEIPANLPGQFSPNGQIFWHWAAATLKGFGEFQNKKF